MAYIPDSGSVAAWLQSDNASVITVNQSSVAVAIVSGSIAASFTPPANQSVSGTVGASIIGWAPVQTSNTSVISYVQNSVATVIIGGSIAASFTPPANQSVSGTVQADIRGSVAAVIIGGSIATATTNSSVMLLNGANTIGSVTALQGTNPWTVVSSLAGGIFPISGSVAATVTNTNLNVGGSVVSFQGGTQITSLVSTIPSSVQVGASIMGQLPAGTAVLGSVATLQGTNPWIITGSVQATAAANQSVSGTVQTDVRASVAVVIIGGSVATATTNSSVMLLNGANTIGSVTTLQGTNPWVIVGSVYGSGSVVAFQGGTNITSLVSTVPSSVQVGASIMGIAPVTLTANTIPPTASILVGVTANTNGSVLTTTGYPQAVLQITSGPGASITGQINFEGTIDGTQFLPIQGYNLANNQIASGVGVESNWAFNTAGLQGIRGRVSNWSVGSITARAVLSPSDARPLSAYNAGGFSSVSGTVGASIVGQLPAGVAMIGSVAAYQGTVPWAVAGSVTAFQTGTWSTSVMTNVITSIATAGQVMGSVAALQATNPWNVAGSVAAFVVGNSSVITYVQNSSILAVPVGSTIALLQSPSIVGTYAEDAGHTTADRGIFTMGVRNDTVTSITSADTDYSPHVVDAVGRTIVKPFAGENATIISYVGSIVSGSVQLIQASVIGSRSYVTDFWLSNTGAATTLVTIQGGDTSILGQFIAPTGGGMSSPGIAIPLRTTASQDLAFKVSPSSSVLYVVLKGYQAP